LKLEEPAMLLRSLLPFRRPRRSEMWALRAVDLEVARGETVGVLGRNGAGKTSLLRLLAGVTQPTEGHLRVRGRIAPLISVGVGFHPEMSGRENVYLNGMLLGLTKAEVEERLDAIVAFAELADFIDTPVKFYSSGMFMRLGFSVAVHADPQVLLVDEVLAVGDVAFQLKCLERMRQIQESGTTIIIVSHSMHAIRLLCPRAVLLRRGRVEFDGAAETAITRHHELLTTDAVDTGPTRPDDVAMVGGVTVLERELRGPYGAIGEAQAHVPMTWRVRLRFDRDVDSPRVLFDVLSEDGTLAYEMSSEVGRDYRSFRAGDEAEVVVAFTPRLGGGSYRLVLTLTSATGRQVLLRDPVGTYVYFVPPLGSGGIADLDATITVDDVALCEHGSLLLGGSAPPDELEG
jgi:ABC-type polysaccharide/polyol phosphate transport system ATPase subunit